jgi:hypothetical protein
MEVPDLWTRISTPRPAWCSPKPSCPSVRAPPIRVRVVTREGEVRCPRPRAVVRDARGRPMRGRE